MTYQNEKNSITIPRKEAEKMRGFVVLPLKEYDKLREQAVPNFYLEGKEAEELDKLVKEGLREYKQGKCKRIKSLVDLD